MTEFGEMIETKSLRVWELPPEVPGYPYIVCDVTLVRGAHIGQVASKIIPHSYWRRGEYLASYAMEELNLYCVKVIDGEVKFVTFLC